jgi:small GTP-binding protein
MNQLKSALTKFRDSNSSVNNANSHQLEPLLGSPYCGEKKYDQKFTIVLAGDEGTGKTSFLNYLLGHTFADNTKPTTNFDYQLKTLEVDGIVIEINFIDLSGNIKQANYNIISEAHAIFYFFDVTNTRSYESLFNWMDHFKKYKYKNKTVLQYIIGNKIDEENVLITREDVNTSNLSKSVYFECSSKTGEYVMAIVTNSMKKLIKHYGTTSGNGGEVDMDITKIFDSEEDVKTRWCCFRM